MEVLVALLVLEVGLMGAVGMTLQAQRTLRVAAVHEAVAAAAGAIADSLARVGWTRSGDRRMNEGELSWSLDGSGMARVTFQGHGTLRLEVGFLTGGTSAP